MRPGRPNLVRTGREQPHGMLQAGVDSGSPHSSTAPGGFPCCRNQWIAEPGAGWRRLANRASPTAHSRTEHSQTEHSQTAFVIPANWFPVDWIPTERQSADPGSAGRNPEHPGSRRSCRDQSEDRDRGHRPWRRVSCPCRHCGPDGSAGRAESWRRGRRRRERQAPRRRR
jgi:hypothetical protein